jgi:hypothetical protein
MLFADLQEQEELSFSLNGNDAKGTWKKTAGSKPLSFSAKEITGDIPFMYVYTSGVAALRPRLKTSPQATFEAAAIWPEGNATKEQFIKQVVRQAFDEKSGAGEIGAVLLKSKKEFLASYASEYSTASDKEIGEVPYAYTMDHTSRLLIAYQSPQILTLAHFNYLYSGGAHGNYATSFTTLNLSENKKLQLNEVLNEGGIKALTTLLPKYFRKSNGLKAGVPLTEGGLFEDKLEPNSNFYVTGKGLGFTYSPYEVGPYALGEINVFIPYTELQMYLRPSFKKLME